jgi:hypothetical protein
MKRGKIECYIPRSLYRLNFVLPLVETLRVPLFR